MRTGITQSRRRVSPPDMPPPSTPPRVSARPTLCVGTPHSTAHTRLLAVKVRAAVWGSAK
eukprot:2282378-Rhodomonas_salina.2